MIPVIAILNYILIKGFHYDIGNAIRTCTLDETKQVPSWGIASTINCVSPSFVTLEQEVNQ